MLKNTFRGEQNKAPHVLPSPEDVQEGRPLSFNYNPQMQPHHNLGAYALTEIKDFIEDCYKVFKSCGNCDIKVVPELSRLGRWHFHGWIVINNVMDFYLSDIHKIINKGTVYVNHLADADGWKDYVYKQHNLMIKISRREDFEYELDTTKPIKNDLTL